MLIYKVRIFVVVVIVIIVLFFNNAPRKATKKIYIERWKYILKCVLVEYIYLHLAIIYVSVYAYHHHHHHHHHHSSHHHLHSTFEMNGHICWPNIAIHLHKHKYEYVCRWLIIIIPSSRFSRRRLLLHLLFAFLSLSGNMYIHIYMDNMVQSLMFLFNDLTL